MFEKLTEQLVGFKIVHPKQRQPATQRTISLGNLITNHEMAPMPGKTKAGKKWEYSSQSASPQGYGEKSLRRRLWDQIGRNGKQHLD